MVLSGAGQEERQSNVRFWSQDRYRKTATSFNCRRGICCRDQNGCSSVGAREDGPVTAGRITVRANVMTESL